MINHRELAAILEARPGRTTGCQAQREAIKLIKHHSDNSSAICFTVERDQIETIDDYARANKIGRHAE